MIRIDCYFAVLAKFKRERPDAIFVLAMRRFGHVLSFLSSSASRKTPSSMPRNLKNGKHLWEPNGKGKVMEDYWTDIPVLGSQSRERNGYPTQKPESLLERIIKVSSNEGDTVADFFCGSGTSIVVAKKLGRKYIGCDVNARAIEIAMERLSECIPTEKL